MNPYDVLGVDRSATLEQVRSAFRHRSRAMHPDQNPAAVPDHAALAELAAAWHVLGDAARRAAYDRATAAPVDVADPPPPWLRPTRPTPAMRGDDSSTSTLMRRAFVAFTFLVVVVLVTFTVLAFAESG